MTKCCYKFCVYMAQKKYRELLNLSDIQFSHKMADGNSKIYAVSLKGFSNF
jgi:hypothetical protein